MKYLYTVEKFTDNVFKYEVERESEKNYWLKTKSTPIMISKKTLKTGNGYSTEYYYEATDEWEERFRTSKIKRMYKKALQELKSCKDEAVMKQIIIINKEVKIDS